MAWIFTYNELMWDFPYPHQMRKKALLEEHHRSFNYLMTDRYGAPSSPAPGLGFETSGDCRGYAYLVPEEEEDEVLETLQKIHTDRFLLKEASIIVDNQSSEEAFFLHLQPQPPGLHRKTGAPGDRQDCPAGIRSVWFRNGLADHAV